MWIIFGLLVALLGNPSHATREQFHQQLLRAPEIVPYMELLRHSSDPEVTKRAAEIVEHHAIDTNLFLPWVDALVCGTGARPWEEGQPRPWELVWHYHRKVIDWHPEHCQRVEYPYQRYRYATRLLVDDLNRLGIPPVHIAIILGGMQARCVYYVENGKYPEPPIQSAGLRP